MSIVTPKYRAFRGSILHFLADPGESENEQAYAYFADGLMLVKDGLVDAVGDYVALASDLPANTVITDYSGKLIMPGFIDTHIHFPQTDIIAAPGTQLLDWLERYTFPAESRFDNEAHATEVAEFFLDELLRNGTTTALVFGSVHRASIDAFFTVAEQRKLRMVAGKVLMDRHSPEYLRDTPDTGFADSAALIERWHGLGRLGYAITPRFAITSSDQQLARAGELALAYPQVHIHSHLAENHDEVAWVARLFPWSRSYLDVYDHFGLLREGAVYAHCIHLDEEDRKRMVDSGATAAFCPTSNLFLGSGLFDLAGARDASMRVGIATDVGGGTSFSLLQTLGASYNVAQLRGYTLSPLLAFYMITLGNARSLGLDQHIGNFAVGKEADFVVLDPDATPLLARRMQSATSLAERLFLWMIMGDDRAISATYVLGNLAHSSTETIQHA
ncbi:guanine deaminase [Sulfuriferula nivalis]|uniref:Guanine deaminase n=1 Tax=Sulfuriferula nivalis TaxID=2675298 RepID=A0A809RHA5_9PROT|nr:guanine deaminase [Sulfuriferula nivalis]BBP00935.1 guanine deaminase [Sulfuriferula nivalis]